MPDARTLSGSQDLPRATPESHPLSPLVFSLPRRPSLFRPDFRRCQVDALKGGRRTGGQLPCSPGNMFLGLLHAPHTQGRRSAPHTMKTSVASLFGAAGVVACCSSCASAFVVPSVAVRARRPSGAAPSSSSSGGSSSSRRTMKLSAEKKDEEEDQEPMDLDLEQMFEVLYIGVCLGLLCVSLGRKRRQVETTTTSLIEPSTSLQTRVK